MRRREAAALPHREKLWRTIAPLDLLLERHVLSGLSHRANDDDHRAGTFGFDLH